MNLTLVRHAQVDEKYLGAYNGHIDISLSKLGNEQAKTLAKKFQNKSFDAVFCSDLKRAKETLQTFTNIKEIIYTPKLREKSWGKHEGLKFEEIGIEYKNFLDFIHSLDGEDIDIFSANIKDFFYNYLPSLQKKNILIITHAGVIKTLLSFHENISLESAFTQELAYASITRITI